MDVKTKFIIDYYIYRNDEWQDREVEVFGFDAQECLTEFKEQNRLARKVTIRRV